MNTRRKAVAKCAACGLLYIATAWPRCGFPGEFEAIGEHCRACVLKRSLAKHEAAIWKLREKLVAARTAAAKRQAKLKQHGVPPPGGLVLLP